MAFRAQDIVDIISAVSYTIPVRFFPYEVQPNQRIYPLVEVVNVRPEGTKESVDVTEETNTFEVRILLKYNRTEDLETQDLHDTEKTILSLLETAILADKLITLESKEWARSDIRKNPFTVNGVQSTLTVTILEKKSTTGSGTLGGQMTLTLPGSIVLNLLSRPASTDGRTFDDDRMEGEQRALTDKGNIGATFFEYESTFALDSSIQTLIDTGNEISVTLSKNGNDIIFTGLLIKTTKTAPYDNIERSILHMEIN